VLGSTDHKQPLATHDYCDDAAPKGPFKRISHSSIVVDLPSGRRAD
jgi:hypothetical protein